MLAILWYGKLIDISICIEKLLIKYCLYISIYIYILVFIFSLLKKHIILDVQVEYRIFGLQLFRNVGTTELSFCTT